MFRFIIILLFLNLLTSMSNAQFEKLDSLKSIINTEKETSIYLQIADYYYLSYPDTSIYFYKKALEKSINEQDTSSILFTYINLGSLQSRLFNVEQSEKCYNEYLKYCRNFEDSSHIFVSIATLFTQKGEYLEAIKYFDELLPYYLEKQDTARYIDILINSSVVLSRQSLNDRASERLYEALELSYNEKHSENLPSIYQNLGEIFAKQKNYKKAIEYFSNAVFYFKKSKNDIGACGSFLNLSSVYIEMEEIDTAKLFLDTSQMYNNNLQIGLYKGYINFNYGQIQYLNKNFAKAIEFYEKSIVAQKETQNSNGLTHSYLAIAECLIGLNKLDEAEKYSDSSLTISIQNGALEMEAETYKVFSKIYTLKKDPLKNIKYLNLYIETIDSLEKIMRNKQIMNLEYIYQTQEKEKEIIKLNYESKIKNQEIEKRKNINYLLITLLFFVVIVFFIIFKLFKQKQKLKQEKNLIETKFKSEEKIKEKIALELHDNIAGNLLTIINKLSDNQIQIEIKNIYSEIRRLSHSLSEPVFTDVNFQEKINALIVTYSKIHDIEIGFFDDFSLIWSEIKDNEKIQKSLYRISQELIANAIKHAKCSEIEIQLINSFNELNLMYNDNGIGFDNSNLKKGIGLENISKRAKMFNGSVHIDSKIGHGTTIMIKFTFELNKN